MLCTTASEAHRRQLVITNDERGVPTVATNSPRGAIDFRVAGSVTELVGDQTSMWNKEVIGVRRLIGEFSDSKQAKPTDATVKRHKGNFGYGLKQSTLAVESSSELRDGQKSEVRVNVEQRKLTLRRQSDATCRERSRKPKFDHIGLD